MAKILEIKCVVSEVDLHQYFRDKTRLFRWTAATIGVFVPLYTAYMFVEHPKQRSLDEIVLLIGPALIMGLLALHFSFVQAWLSARDTLNKNPALRDASYRFSEDGITAAHLEGESRVSWSGIKKATENQNMFLIYHQNGAAHILPKSNFTTAQVQEMRELLRETLQERALIPDRS